MNGPTLEFFNPNKPGRLDKELAKIIAKIALQNWMNDASQNPAIGQEENHGNKQAITTMDQQSLQRKTTK